MSQPFFHAQVQLVAPPKGEMAGGNFVVRGIVLPLASGYCVVFDQELPRVAGLWRIPAGGAADHAPTMAPISYANPRRKTAADHPQPTGRLLLTTGMHPGVALDAADMKRCPAPQGGAPR